MSYITTAVVFFDIQENFEEDYSDRLDHPISRVNEWLRSQYNEMLHPLPQEVANGCVEANTVWVGLFSHLDTDELLNVVRLQKWRVEEGVEVIFKGEENENLLLFKLRD